MRQSYLRHASLLLLALSGCSSGSGQSDDVLPASGASSGAPAATTANISVTTSNPTTGTQPSSPVGGTPTQSNTAPSQVPGASTSSEPEPSQSPTADEPAGTTPVGASSTAEAPPSSAPTQTAPSASATPEPSMSMTSAPPGGDVVDTGADEKFSFFVTSYYHIVELSGSSDGFGGDLRYNGSATGLEGADAICQEMARRVAFGHRSWKAYLSTSTVNAIDRIGAGPWYDFVGALVANSPDELVASGDRQPGGCCDTGTYDETGTFHDGKTDVNNDGQNDDDHDTMTATNADGTYAGFSCEDWTSTTASASGGGGGGGGPGGGGGGGIMMGHSWPARSGEHWAQSHGGHACAAGTNFVQDGGGDSSTVGGGGGYGGIYCFALPE